MFLGEKYDGDIVRKSLYSNKGTGDIVINVDTNGYYSAVLFFYGYDPDFIAVVHIKKGYAARISQVLGKLILGAMAENKICYSLTDNKIVLKLNKNNSQGNVNLLFFVGFGYGGSGEMSTYKCKPFIQQIGKGNPCGSGVQAFTKELRIVKDGSQYFLDIRYGSIGGTGNRVQYAIRPLCVDNVPIFSVGTTIGDSLTVMAQKTVEYLTE